MYFRLAILVLIVTAIKHYQQVFAAAKTYLEDGEDVKDVHNMVKEMALKIKLLEDRVSQTLELEQKVSRIEKLESRVAEQGKLIQQLMDQVKRCETMDSRATEPNADFVHENNTVTPIGENGNNIKAVRSSGRGVRREVPEHVAFMAYLDHPVGGLTSGVVIKFSSTYLNDGNAYNKFTGVFTVPVDGTYLFTFSIMRMHANQIVAKLVVDNEEKIDAIADPPADGREHQGTNAAILSLLKGQSVWIQADRVESDSIDSWPGDKYCSFAGVLLY